MELVPFGRTDLQVSSLALGAMNFGADGWGCDRRAAAEILRVYRDAGGNFVDTANIYAGGDSESILGELLVGQRDEIVLASKVGFPSPNTGRGGLTPENIRESLHDTLRRLRTDHLDLYQLHAFDQRVGLDDTLGALDDLVAGGLIRHTGSSNFFAWQMAYADGIADVAGASRLVSAQLMYSLVRRDIEREHIGYATQVGSAIIAYGPLHGGQLAAGWRRRSEIPDDSRAAGNPDVYLADEHRVFAVTDALVEHARQIGATPGQVALAWVLRQLGITTTLTAARSARELREQLDALTLDADDDFWASLDVATATPHSYPADFYGRLRGR